MEIRFSDTYVGTPALKPVALWARICEAGTDNNTLPLLTKASGLHVRFTLPGASVDDHDRVIRALLTLDPDATIRTARACYEGLKDFEAQLSVRGK